MAVCSSAKGMSEMRNGRARSLDIFERSGDLMSTLPLGRREKLFQRVVAMAKKALFMDPATQNSSRNSRKCLRSKLNITGTATKCRVFIILISWMEENLMKFLKSYDANDGKLQSLSLHTSISHVR